MAGSPRPPPPPAVLTAVYADVQPLHAVVQQWQHPSHGAAAATTASTAMLPGRSCWVTAAAGAVGGTVVSAQAAHLRDVSPPVAVVHAHAGHTAPIIQAAIGYVLATMPAKESWMRSPHVLARGFRRDRAASSDLTAVRQLHENAAVDFFMSPAWGDVMSAVDGGGLVAGAMWLWSLLTTPGLAVFATDAPPPAGMVGDVNGPGMAGAGGSHLCNLRQVSGLAMDDFVWATPSPPSSTTAAVAVAAEADGEGNEEAGGMPEAVEVGAPTVKPVAVQGRWVLPRCDVQLRLVAKAMNTLDGGAPMAAPVGRGWCWPNPLVTTCCSIYRCHSFATRAGLPAHHVLSRAIAAAKGWQPAPPPTLPLAPAPPSPAAAPVSHDHLPGRITTVAQLQHALGMITVSPPAAAASPPAPTLARNGGGREMAWRAAGEMLHEHIFLHRPHLVETAVSNKVPVVVAKALDTSADAGGRVCEASDHLVGALSHLVRRHAACPYASLLRRHCPALPRPDALPTGDVAAPPRGAVELEARGSGAGAMPLARGPCTDGMDGNGQSKVKVGGKRRGWHGMATTPTDGAVPPSPLDGPAAVHALSTHALPHASVIAFVQACCLHVVPSPLWGDAHTKRHLLAMVAMWVTMTEAERLRVDDVMTGMATTSFGAACTSCGRGSRGGRWHMTPGEVVAWVTWLLLGYVSPLLRSHFYVATMESTQHATVYYRKAMWARVVALSLNALQSQLRLTPLQPEHVARILAGHNRGGLTLGRLVVAPKKVGVRPISDLSSKLPLPVVSSHASGMDGGGTGGKASGATLARWASAPPPTKRPRWDGEGGAPPSSHATLSHHSPSRAAVVRRSTSTAYLRHPADSAASTAHPRHAAAPAPPCSRTATRSINQVLQLLYDVLVCNAGRDAALVGSSVFGVDGFHATLTALHDRWRTCMAAAGSHGHGGDGAMPLYLATADIRGAFDSVRQPLMLEIASRLLPASTETYHIYRYATIQPIPSSRAAGGPAVADTPLSRRVRVRWHRMAVKAGDTLWTTATHLARAAKYQSAVFVDTVEPQVVARARLVNLLTQHLQHHIVRAPGHKYYAQGHGIPQGSVISTLLCNVYLGHYERTVLLPAMMAHLSAANTGDGLPCAGAGSGGASLHMAHALMRWTDDFLMVTPHLPLARAFLHALATTAPAHGLQLSLLKTRLSFWSHAHEGVLGIPSMAASPLVPWCGFLWHGPTRGMYTDVTRYHATHSLLHGLNVWTMTPEEGLPQFLTRLLRGLLHTKAHAILFDASLLSLTNVAINVFQAAYLALAKWVVTLHHLRRHNRYLHWQPNLLLHALARLPHIMDRMVQQRRHRSAVARATQGTAPISWSASASSAVLLMGPHAVYDLHECDMGAGERSWVLLDHAGEGDDGCGSTVDANHDAASLARREERGLVTISSWEVRWLVWAAAAALFATLRSPSSLLATSFSHTACVRLAGACARHAGAVAQTAEQQSAPLRAAVTCLAAHMAPGPVMSSGVIPLGMTLIPFVGDLEGLNVTTARR